MGKASSSKKVQRAARAAASSRGAGERRERGFPLLVGLVVILGVGLVLAARGSRDPAVAPLLDDHWHSAFQIYDCGELMPILTDETDPDGIHTHADGLIHVHPFNSSATGTDASLDVFFDAAGVTVNETTIEARDFQPIDASTGCGDDDAELVIARWQIDGDDGVRLEAPVLVTTYPADPGSIRFLQDREAWQANLHRIDLATIHDDFVMQVGAGGITGRPDLADNLADRKSTRLNSSHANESRRPSSA